MVLVNTDECSLLAPPKPGLHSAVTHTPHQALFLPDLCVSEVNACHVTVLMLKFTSFHNRFLTFYSSVTTGLGHCVNLHGSPCF